MGAGMNEHNHFTEEVLVDIIQVLNKHFPKLGCGYYEAKDENMAKDLMSEIINVKDKYMDLSYGKNRLQK